MTYLAVPCTAITISCYATLYLTFYTLRYKKKSYFHLISCKNKLFDGSALEFMLFHLAATRTFRHRDVAFFGCFPLVHHIVRLLLF